jgi:hypothetical protein
VKQRTFANADEAAGALVEAVRAKDAKALLAVVGPSSGDWLGDAVADTTTGHASSQRMTRSTRSTPRTHGPSSTSAMTPGLFRRRS